MSQTPEQIALERIRRAAENKSESLDLSKLGLTALPPEITQLQNLTTLFLYENQLPALPPEIAQLQNLTTLNLYNNQLAALPPEIGQLQNIAQLVLSSNQLAALPPEITQLQNLTELDLRNNQLAALPSEIGGLQNLAQLNLGSNQLAALPPEIGQLQNLTKLILGSIFGGNKLAALPPEIGQLQNLTTLDLSSNQLAALPPEIGQLQNLTQLHLSGNQLAALPPEIGQLQNLTQLHLSGNQLAALPPEIGQLQNLTTLDLSSNQLAALPPEIGLLQNLARLDLSWNQLTALPPEIGQLQNLTQLDLRRNKLVALPPEIGQLQNLTTLDLGSNQLAALPPEIGQLQNLTTLDLAENQLAALPPEIGQLQNLARLDLRRNKLAALPPEIGGLQNLTTLDLSWNQLTALPPEIARLQNLRRLNLAENQLVALPPEIGQLQNLTELNLRENQLAALPPEIGQLQNLTTLDLAENQLAALPPEIAQLQNLTTLDLGSNQLAALPPEIGQLQNLTQLDLSSNQLAALPPEIAQLQNLRRLNLHDNPLEIAIPAQWLGDRWLGSEFPQEILAYYKQLHDEGGRALGEARALVVGEADAGKTKLLRALLRGEYGKNFKDTRDATEGIEISGMEGKDINIRIWDFGGQEIMHATHRFFLSRNCVYVLVADATRDRDYNQEKIEYWLELIKSHGGAAPTLLVSSKSESFSLDVNKNELQEKYPNLVRGAVLATSAKSGKGVEELRSAIFEQAEKLPSAKVAFPKRFITVKDAIEKLKDKQTSEVVEESEYRKLCQENDIADAERQDVLLQLLHDMGVVLHYKDDDRLSDFGILNPEWATAGVYKLINAPKIKASQGRFALGEVKELLQDEVAYPAAMRRRIVDLMKKFELTYELPLAIDTYILPSALPANQPELNGWDGDAMAFEYQYSILRAATLHRFMVKMHKQIQGEQIWYSGVVIANSDNQALIKADFGKKKILIKVKGKEESRKDFLYLIRTEFESIHGEESPPQEFVYHPKYPDLRLSFEEMKILAKTEREYKTVYDRKPVVVNLRELLDGFVTPEERRQDEEREAQESQRMGDSPREVHYHNHIEVGGDIIDSQFAQGRGNQIYQNSFNSVPAELQSRLIELMKSAEALLGQVKDEEVKEAIKEELEDLQKQAEKPKPNMGKVKISVEGLAKAAKNLNEIGKPALELAATIITFINNLPA